MKKHLWEEYQRYLELIPTGDDSKYYQILASDRCKVFVESE